MTKKEEGKRARARRSQLALAAILRSGAGPHTPKTAARARGAWRREEARAW